ncbi:acyl-ACP--UDP-N-acetylglucosamine O-acyltransferase [Puniceicoccus vermicola]|uniref:Acyl-ACP--UDP-N-acetylglucosamine O-acyltransferase n=1 Tax=Puniceicoccus vermicola TaxID=388746 RepID=A0A7X1E7Q9_9BACT|nr:acyl-ACP--UDP-N-acetylglucosamine O-acyltransferase [Puniceicoccus vermicola]MBC2603997.1 acyl-ACP--UDP-N-acetylglucosamine O-acyltransferase [Puniceicoccus vermicola]
MANESSNRVPHDGVISFLAQRILPTYGRRMIHPTAIVDERAVLGEGVEIGPFCIVEGAVEIGDRTHLAPNAIIRKNTRIGADCKIDSFSVIGGEPNYLGFDPATPSGVTLGDRCVIRESVTIHRSIHADTHTTVGDEVFMMANSHLGHDCIIGDRVVMANTSAMAGHVTVGNDTFFGGGAMVHQFARIGEGAMVAGLSRITRDIGPFILVGERDEISGLNLIGLRRRKVPTETIRELKHLYHAILRSKGNPIENAAQQTRPSSPEARTFQEFFISSKRGYAKNVVA